MLNHQPINKTSAEAMSQISSYFVEVDNAILMGDTNKRYTPSTNTCYAPPVPVQANSYTSVIISPTADNTADIYNGYISANMKVKIKLSTALTALPANFELSNPEQCWVGFKDAMDAIEKYEILANGITIYTQNQAIEESFITSCALPEAAKRSDIYSRVRHCDIFNRKYGDNPGCGAWIKNSAGIAADTAIEVSIPLKIDLRRFLPLSNIKYLPKFAGKVELRLYFSTAGMVCAAMNPMTAFNGWDHYKQKYDIDEVCSEFVPIGEQFKMITTCTNPTTSPAANGTMVAASQTLTAQRDYYMDKCESVIHCFGISQDRFDALVAKYSQVALTFPTQTIAFTPMSNLLNSPNCVSSQTVTPRFIDSIFLLFPMSPKYRSIFKNPQFKSLQLQCGGYGNLPDIAYGTIREPKLFESLQNALNLNNDTVGMNKDVVRSLSWCPASSSTKAEDGFVSFDSTHFLVGFPTETDNTFQQGQTSNTPITYTLTVSQDDNGWGMRNLTTVPLMGCLIDSTFSIQVRPEGPPIVEIGAYDITSPSVA